MLQPIAVDAQNGSATHQTAPAVPKPKQAEQFALEYPHVAGNELQRVERRQKIPFRPDARGSGGERIRLSPQAPTGTSPPETPRTPSAAYQAISSRRKKFGKNFICRRFSSLDPGRRAHAVPLHQSQVDQQQHGGDAGQHRHVETEETGQGAAADILAAAQEARQVPPISGTRPPYPSPLWWRSRKPCSTAADIR